MTSSSPQLNQSNPSTLALPQHPSQQLNSSDTNDNDPGTNESILLRKSRLSPTTDHSFNLHNVTTNSNGTSFHPTKRTNPALGLNSNSPSPSSPNSLGFSKSSFQNFSRIGDPSQPPSPGLFNHPNSHLKKPFHHQPSNHTNPQQHNPSVPGQPNLGTRPRKLGSFNSLATNLMNPTSNQTINRNIGINNNQKEQLNPKLNRDDLKSSEHELDEEHRRDSIEGRLKDSLTMQHKLRSKWVFWILHRAPSKKISEEEFGKAMRRLGSCDTVESFYSLYLHIKRPSNHQPISDIHVFVDPIKPAWEDPLNVQGGKWTIRLKKGLANRLWETLIFSLIGGGLEKLISNSSSSPDDDSDQNLNQSVQKDQKEICGAVLSIRRDEDILAVWHKTGSPEAGGDGLLAKQVKLSLQTVLQLPLNCNLSYKLNVDCLSTNGVLNLTNMNQNNYNHHHSPNHNHNHNPNNHHHYQQQQNKSSGQDQFNTHHHSYNSTNNKGNLNRNTNFGLSSNKNHHSLSPTNHLNNEPKIGINLASNHLQFHNQAPSIGPGFGNLGSGSANNTNLKKN